MADNNLTVTVTGNTSDLEARLGALETAFQRTGGATASATEAARAHTEAQAGTVGALERTQVAVGGLSEGFEQLATHTRVVSNGLEVIGLEGDAAATKLAGLAEVLEGISSAAPGLLLIGGAIAGATALFGFLKEAVSGAAEEMQSLQAIGAMAESLGGSFEAASTQVNELATKLAETTGKSKSEFIDGVKEMVAAGMSVETAMRSQDAAAAISLKTGRDLTEVELALTQAYLGHPRALEAIGGATRGAVEAGETYNQMLAQNAVALKNVAEYTNNPIAQFDILGQKIEENVVEIGANFTPALTQLGKDLNTVVDESGGFVTWLENVAESGPGITAITLALGAGLVWLTLEGIVPATAALVRFALGLTVDAVVAVSNFSRAITVDALQALLAFTASISGQVMGALRTFALMIAVEGVGAVRTFAVSIFETALPALGAMLVSMGEVLIPIALVGAAIAGLAYLFKNHLSEVENVTDTVITFVVNKFGQLVEGIGAAMKFIGGVLGHFGFKGAETGLDNAAKAVTKFGQGAEHANVHVAKLAATVTSFVKGAVGGAFNFLTPHPEAVKSGPLGGGGDGNSSMDEKKPKGESGSMDELIGAFDKGNPIVAAFKQEQIDLDAALKKTDASEASLAEKVKTATTTSAQRTAQANLEAQTYVDLVQKQTALKAATDEETDTNTRLQATITAEVSARDKLAAAHDAIAEKQRAGATLSATESREMKSLAEQVKNADGEISKLNGALSENTSNLNKNNAALTETVQKLADMKNKSEETAAAASRAWDDYLKKREQQNADERATNLMTNQQKAAYYAQTLSQLEALDANYKAQFIASQAEMTAADASKNQQRITAAYQANAKIASDEAANEKRMEQILGDYDTAYKAELKQQEDAHKAFIDTATKDETTFLDDVLSKHKSLRESLKDVWNDILGDWTKMIEQMIVKATMLQTIAPMVQKIMASMGLGAAIGLGSVSPAGAAMTSPAGVASASPLGALSALTSSSTSATGGAPKGTHSDPVHVLTDDSGSAYNYNLTGDTQGVPGLTGGATSAVSAPDAMAEFYGPNDQGGAVNVDGGDGMGEFYGATDGGPQDSLGNYLTGNSAADLTDPSDSSGAGLGGILGSIAQGATVGAGVSGMLGGNTTDGAIGGAIGGTAGSLLFGPVGGMVGSAIGGAVGGLFGPKAPNATDNPDEAGNVAEYQQDLHNWQGNTGAASQYDTGQGGTPEWKLMEQWAASNANNSSLTPDQQAMLAQINGLDGGNSNADLNINNLHQGILTMDNGSTISAADMEQLSEEFGSQAGSAAASAVFQITRGYPDFNIGTLSANGTYTPTTVTIPTATTPTTGTTTGSGSTSTGSGGSAGGAGGGSGTVHVEVVVQGHVVGSNGMSELAQTISTEVTRTQRGLNPGGANAWGSATRYSAA